MSCALKIVLYFCVLSLSSIISRNRGFSALIFKFHLQLTVGVGTLLTAHPNFAFWGPQTRSIVSEIGPYIRALWALNNIKGWSRRSNPLKCIFLTWLAELFQAITFICLM